MMRPPRLGHFLLERLGSHNDGLLGDLTEEYQRRQSSWWYWRQAIAAIVIGAINDIRSHRLLALRAITFGFLATRLSYELIGRPLNRFLKGWVLDQLIFTLRSHPFVMLWATDFSSWPAMIAVNLISGWIVARGHRDHAGVLLAFVLVTFVRAFGHALSIALIPIISIPAYVNLPAPGFRVVSQALIPPLFVLIGAIWGQGRRDGLRAT